MNWLILICIIFIASESFARLAVFYGQARVIGQICAGIMLGIIFSVVPTDSVQSGAISDAIIALKPMGELALIFIMFEIPWHITDANKSGQAGGRLLPALVAIGGVGISFAFGILVAALSHEALAPNQPFWSYVMFCALALSLTALPVLISMTNDVTILPGAVVSVSVFSAVYTDIFAWFALAAVLALHYGDEAGFLGGAINLLTLVCIAVLIAALVRPRLSKLNEFAKLGGRLQALVVLVCCLVLAELTSILGYHHAIGAVLAGVLFYDLPKVRKLWRKWLGSFNALMLVPIFFAYAGLNLSVTGLFTLTSFIWICAFTVAGTLGKILGSYIAGRIGGLSPRTAVQVGILTSTKGLIELVVLNVGLEEGVLSDVSYSVLLVASLTSTVLTLPLLKFFNRMGNVRHRPCDADDRKRTSDSLGG